LSGLSVHTFVRPSTTNTVSSVSLRLGPSLVLPSSVRLQLSVWVIGSGQPFNIVRQSLGHQLGHFTFSLGYFPIRLSLAVIGSGLVCPPIILGLPGFPSVWAGLGWAGSNSPQLGLGHNSSGPSGSVTIGHSITVILQLPSLSLGWVVWVCLAVCSIAWVIQLHWVQ